MRKFQLEAELIAAARAFLNHVREHEIQPSTIVIPLDEKHDDLLARGSASAITRLLQNRA